MVNESPTKFHSLEEADFAASRWNNCYIAMQQLLRRDVAKKASFYHPYYVVFWKPSSGPIFRHHWWPTLVISDDRGLPSVMADLGHQRVTLLSQICHTLFCWYVTPKGYLCAENEEGVLKYSNKIAFPLLFRLICTIFAPYNGYVCTNINKL